MAFEENLKTISLTAAADLSAKQYYFMKVDSNGKAAVCGDGEKAIGVLQNDPASGQAATVGVDGVTKVVASAAITKGTAVASSSAGKAAAPGTSDVIVGIALTSSGADGDIISVLLYPMGAS
jgi:hypothetical protein